MSRTSICQPEFTPYPDARREPIQAHADTDGLPLGEVEPEQGPPVTDDDMRRMFGLAREDH